MRRELIELAPESILFADDDLIAVDKDSGVLCDASRDPERDHLGLALERWANDPTTRFHAAHRLDLGTSGVVLFARHRAANTAIMQQFQDRTVAKRYQAIVHLPAEEAWTVGHSFERRSYLRHRKGKSEEVRSGGKSAQTGFEVADIDGALALVNALPKTGRTHQLRVHLSAGGTPIAGDQLYGDPAFAHHWPRGSSGFWLHASRLSLTHPTTGDSLTIESNHTLALASGSPTQRDL